MADAAAFEHERRRLTGLAYRMLGRWSEAEDVVQDAAIRFLAADSASIRSVPAFLTTLTMRLAIDRLRREKARRETYPGPWLPEPVETPLEDSIGGDAIAQDLSMALLLLFERLSPEERAAFILREALKTPYDEIAAALNKSEPAVRQIVSRARARIHTPRRRTHAGDADQMAMIARLSEAVASGDKTRVAAVLAPNAVLLSDGGGLRPAALRPIEGVQEIVDLLFGLKGFTEPPRALRIAALNGAPAVLVINAREEETVLQFDLEGGLVSAIYISRNPEKMRHLAFT